MTVTCKICGAQFQSFRGLNGHMNKHRPLRAEPNIEGYTDDLIMDIYLDEGESYDDAHYYARRAQNKLTHRSEDFTPRTGKKITLGRKQKWISHAIQYLQEWGSATATEILPNLPDYTGSGRPINNLALSARLIRLPEIFKVDKTTRPYTFSLVESKEMSLEDDERICFTCGEITSDWDLINEGYECSECSELNRTDYERRKFGVEAYDEKITVWICNACNRRYEDQNDAEVCCVGVEEVPYFDGKSKELREVHLHEAESSDYDGDVKMYYELEIDDRHGNFAQISGSFVYDSRVWDFFSYADLEYDEGGPYLADIYWEDAEIWPSDSELGTGSTLADFPDDQRGISPWLQWDWWSGPPQEVLDRLVERFTAEFEQLSDATMAVSDRYDVNVGYIVATDGDDDEGDDDVTIEILDDDFEQIAELELGQIWHDYNPDDEEYFHAPKKSDWVTEITVHVEVPDKRNTQTVTFQLPTHIANNPNIQHEAVENRLYDILQEPFGGWDVISMKEVQRDFNVESFEAVREDYFVSRQRNNPLSRHYIPKKKSAENFNAEKPTKTKSWREGEEGMGHRRWLVGKGYSGRAKCKVCGEIISKGQPTIDFHSTGGIMSIHSRPEDCAVKRAENFEANFNPDQPRDTDGRWVDPDESDFIKTDSVVMDIDFDELMALAEAIRIHDSTFPDVEMLLEQIGDTAEHRQMIFQEMLDVLTQTINEVMSQPTVETPEEHYKYILEEEVEDEMDRLYRQANYYAQFKTSADIDEALEELYFQYQMAKEMGAEKDIVNSIEKDINFVELVSRVQDMQREYTAETIYVPSPLTTTGATNLPLVKPQTRVKAWTCAISFNPKEGPHSSPLFKKYQSVMSQYTGDHEVYSFTTDDFDVVKIWVNEMYEVYKTQLHTQNMKKPINKGKETLILPPTALAQIEHSHETEYVKRKARHNWDKRTNYGKGRWELLKILRNAWPPKRPRSLPKSGWTFGMFDSTAWKKGFPMAGYIVYDAGFIAGRERMGHWNRGTRLVDLPNFGYYPSVLLTPQQPTTVQKKADWTTFNPEGDACPNCGAVDSMVERTITICDECSESPLDILGADWNPQQPRVPCPTCKKREPCPCPGPGKMKPQDKPRPNVMPPTPTPEHDTNHWVNRQTGETHRGNKPKGAQWRAVEKVPVVINGKQRYIDNIMDEIVKMWPPSSIVYRRNPPLIIIVDDPPSITRNLNIKGIKIEDGQLTYE